MDFENYILAMQYFCCLEIWEISKHKDCAIIEFKHTCTFHLLPCWRQFTS